MGGLRRRRAQEAEEEAVRALSRRATYKSRRNCAKRLLAQKDTSKASALKKLRLRTACVRPLCDGKEQVCALEAHNSSVAITPQLAAGFLSVGCCSESARAL